MNVNYVYQKSNIYQTLSKFCSTFLQPKTSTLNAKTVTNPAPALNVNYIDIAKWIEYS